MVPGGRPCSTTLLAISITAVSKSITSVLSSSGCSSRTRSRRSCRRFSVSGTARVSTRYSPAMDRVTHGVERLQDAVEVGQVEHHPHLLLGGRDPQVAAGLTGALEPGDQGAEAGGVDEARAGQVDDKAHV